MEVVISITEIDGVAWCLAHDHPWFEGTTECDYLSTYAEDDECIEAPLFHGLAIGAEPHTTEATP